MDALDFATLAILCRKHDGQLHPVAFWSRKSNPAECNYDIHDHEMLPIVLALSHWHHYCEGTKHTIMIFTDHKNLEVFMSSKILNRRQARWAELLSGYDFVLVHTRGSTNTANGPSHRPDYTTDVPQPSGSCELHRCSSPVLHLTRLTLLKCSGYRLLCLSLPRTLHCANSSSMHTTPMQLLWHRKSPPPIVINGETTYSCISRKSTFRIPSV
jgi:hypothetical protein